jgi:CPA2 family monovalent cation:H+ antiporter-2
MGSPAFLGPLALVLLAALAAAWLVHRVRQPPLVGFLAAGVLLGPYGLGLVRDVAAVEVLAEVGVVLLLFTVGLDLSVSTLKRLSRIVWIAGPIQFAGVIALGVGLAHLRGDSLSKGVLFGFLVATCSTVILFKLLMDRGEMDAPHGQFLVGINVFGDLMVVPMMLLVGPLSGHGATGWAPMGLALAKAAATVAVIFFAARLVVPRFLTAIVRRARRSSSRLPSC